LERVSPRVASRNLLVWAEGVTMKPTADGWRLTVGG
jgi:hypothetical protein